MDSPQAKQAGTLYAAAPDAVEPTHYCHAGQFGDLWPSAWTLIGRTAPDHCGVEGGMLEFGLTEANMTPMMQAVPSATQAKLGWQSEDGKWRLVVKVRAPEWGATPARRVAVTGAWPIFAVPEEEPRFFRAVTAEEHNAEVRASRSGG